MWIRPLEEGDIVNVDISVYLNGAHGDLNETFYVGEVDDDSRRLTEGTYASLMEAIKQCKPGMYYREIGNIINDVADKFGYFSNLNNILPDYLSFVPIVVMVSVPSSIVLLIYLITEKIKPYFTLSILSFIVNFTVI